MTHKITEVRMLDHEVWSVQYLGQATEHRFPHDTLRWRAAEYGIDPLDSETLLRVVLHEPFIDTRAENPEFLYNIDQGTARAAHLRKIDQVRAAGGGVDDPDGHGRTIHDHHARTFDPADHAAKTAAVANNRRNTAQRRP